MLKYMRLKNITNEEITYVDPNNPVNVLVISGWTTPNPPGIISVVIEQAMEMDGTLVKLPMGGIDHGNPKQVAAITEGEVASAEIVETLQDKLRAKLLTEKSTDKTFGIPNAEGTGDPKNE